jgi:putative methionine-R-sulfoxide reductase with GAF domain
MGRGPKPDKGKAKPASSHTSAKHGDTRVLNLKKRLAEAEQREAEALKREAATSEVLRVIASSPTELQPVLDAMAESAARLCAAYDAVIWRLEGDSLRVVAHHGPVGQVATHVIPVLRGTVTGRTVLDRQTVQVTDLQAEVDEFPEGSAFARQFGHRSIVSVPLLREGVAIGVIALRRGRGRGDRLQGYLLHTIKSQYFTDRESVPPIPPQPPSPPMTEYVYSALALIPHGASGS